MTLNPFSLGRIAWAVAVLAALGCGGSPPELLQPSPVPTNTQPPPPVTAPPVQTQLPPPPPKLEPPPQATKRVAVLVTERIGREGSARRDTESEAILSEALLVAGRDLGLEVVRTGTFEDILKRDFDSLVHKGLDENAKVFSNLLQAGVDYFALGELGASEHERETPRGRVIAERFSVHAGVQLVRTDDATVLTATNGDGEDRALRDAKTRALSEAARRLAEALRAEPKGHRAVTITIDGLASFTDAERIQIALRSIPGVLWTRDVRYSTGTGPASGIARYELAWMGAPEDLRARVGAIDAGVKLDVTKVEGSRWNYHATPRAAANAAPSAPAPAASGPDPKKESQ